MTNLVPDTNLKRIINEYFSRPEDTQITKSDLESINSYIYTDDSSIGYYISSLEGLQYAKNMTELLIENNLIIDINAINSLEKLNTLFLNNNNIKNIPDLSKMANLNSLLLSCNKIQDISPLATSKSLRVIKLNENMISDLSPLSSIENISDLKARDQNIQINDVLDLSDYYVLDISFLKDIHGKTPYKIIPSDLGIYSEINKKIIWESEIVTYKNPSFTFSCEDCNFSGEVTINIIGLNKIISIPDDNLKDKIKSILDISHNIITKKDLLKLRTLDISKMDITSLKGLEHAENLYTLIVDESNITDFQYIPSSVTYFSAKNLIQELSIPDKKLKSIINITLNKNDKSIITLEDIRRLTVLDEFGSYIKNLDGLQYAENLQILSLVRNKICDISFLSNLKKLTYLDLRENNLYDLSYLSSIYKDIKFLYANKQEIYIEKKITNHNDFIELSLDFLKDLDGNIIKNIYPSHNGKYIEDNNSIIWFLDRTPSKFNFTFSGIDNIFSGTVYVHISE